MNIIELTVTIRYEERDRPTVGDSVSDVREAIEHVRVPGVTVVRVDIEDWDEAR